MDKPFMEKCMHIQSSSEQAGVHYDRKANRVYSVQYASVVQQPKRASVYNTSIDINIYIMKVRLIGICCVRGALERGSFVLDIPVSMKVLSSL
jgi:hypothetical protein